MRRRLRSVDEAMAANIGSRLTTEVSVGTGMNRFITLASFASVLLMAGSVCAKDKLRDLTVSEGRAWTATSGDAGKAARDTIYLMGGPDLPNTGDFEAPGGGPAWNGWQHTDVTAPSVNYWHVDTYHMENLNNNGAGNHGAWCGSILYPACLGESEPGGYGDFWNDGLDYWGTVADNGVNATVDIEFWYNVHTELDFDWFNVNIDRAGTWEQIEHTSAVFENVHFMQTVTFLPEDYVNGNEFHIQLQVTSDIGYSDQDCLWPSAGAVQVDDISISGTNGVVTYFEDFEDGELGDWTPTFIQGAGDFTQLWQNLCDIDICSDNFTTQVAFIDDGQVVPGVGPSECISWCYGPNGWVVNHTGGALGGPDDHIFNWVYSPALEWPMGDYDGGQFRWNVYSHEEWTAGISTGILYCWAVRSVNTGEPAQLAIAPWESDGSYGGPEYLDTGWDITSHLVAGRTHVMVGLGCWDIGWMSGIEGVDGTPAPYFDNVRVLVYPFHGPGINIDEYNMAQDVFPERGVVDYGDLASNWCRFDAAQNVAPDADLWNDPGDSITFNVAPVRAGATMTEVRMFYKIKPNPLFNSVRVQAPGANGFIEGFVDADTSVTSAGVPIAGRWAIDMPDTGFFYPGDVMHYYIKATDDTGGNPLSRYAPPDTTGFSDFNTILGYQDTSDEREFIVHFLPTVFSQTIGDHPKILWWNDYGSRGGQNEWYYALANNGFLEGIDFDTYYTNCPTNSSVGNGIGRASAALLDGYDTILYTSGTVYLVTISNGDPNSDAGNDVGVLDAWLQDGDRNMLLTGDELAYSLAGSGSATLAFLNNWIGVDHQTRSILDFIDNQMAPTVRITPVNPVFATVDEWIAFGGCPGINTFDGVTITTATRIAEFLNPQGQGGSYAYAAATYNDLAAFNDQIIYLPYDLMSVYTAPGNSGLPARAKVLGDVLLTFNQTGGSPVTPVPEIGVFAVKNYPNPFNPQTKIEFTLPQRGQVSVKIFNVRGELVRTLVDEVREGNVAHVAVWSGIDDRGAEVSSGVYFYEVRTNGITKINKMALVK